MSVFRGGLENILLDVQTYLRADRTARAKLYIQPSIVVRYLFRRIETGGDYQIFPAAVESMVATKLADEIVYRVASSAVLDEFRARMIDMVQQLWDRGELVWLDTETRFLYKGSIS